MLKSRACVSLTSSVYGSSRRSLLCLVVCPHSVFYYRALDVDVLYIVAFLLPRHLSSPYFFYLIMTIALCFLHPSPLYFFSIWFVVVVVVNTCSDLLVLSFCCVYHNVCFACVIKWF